MIVALILAGIFYLIGAFVAGKLLKRKAKTWQAIISAAVLFIGWLWLLHVSYKGNVPSVASSQVAFSSITLFWGLKSKTFLDDSEKKEEPTTKREE